MSSQASLTHSVSRRTIATLTLAAALAAFVPAFVRAGGEMVSVIVRSRPGVAVEAERTVTELGGRVGRRIAIVDGFTADVPSNAIDQIRGAAAVHSVSPNRAVHLLHTVEGFDAATDAGSIYNTTKAIKAQDVWRTGITGAGVDVALIDSGVVPVNGLTGAGKVVNGPDLSFESQADNLRYLDTFGHGTHMAGIIAGRDNGASSVNDLTAHDTYAGVAPDARIINLKVANARGATDVSQVLAAIDWVVQHRNDNGMNIRVLSLSFGTDGTQDYMIDPLAYAVEVAWRKGIVVVVAAGNSGYGSAKLNNPAYDPYVIAVGADDTKGTHAIDDDVIPAWSSRGDGTRNPDVVAPGKSIAGLRAPGSYIDETYPAGRVASRLFRGSGTSQATAVVSGAAALLLQQRPNLTPDQVKKLLSSTASPLPAADPVAQGSGLINLKSATAAATPNYVQTWPTSNGTGSLEAARGSAHVEMDGVALTGEQDIFGTPWDGTSWSGTSWSGTSWSGGLWNGTSWSGTSWSGTSWSGTSWSGTSWSGTSWSGTSWSGTSWSGTSWSGTSWSGTSWSGTSWSGTSWSGTSWSGTSWSGTSWSGSSWSASDWV
ncbi:MAG: S8 family peptidase [Actinomycetota bacterium]